MFLSVITQKNIFSVALFCLTISINLDWKKFLIKKGGTNRFKINLKTS